MEHLRGWRALRQDPDWLKKLVIAGVIMLVPIVGPIVVTGWTSLMLRRAVSGQDGPLPRLDFDFDYLGKLLNTGFKGFLAQLLWSLPMVAVLMATYCCFYIAMIGAMAGLRGNEDMMGVVMICMIGGMMLVYMVLALAAVMPMVVAMLRAELTDDVAPAMRLKDVFAMTRMMAKELVVGQFILMLVGVAAMIFSLLTCYLGLLPAMAALQVIHAYWRAELYQRYLAMGGEPLAVGPLDVNSPQQPSAPMF